MPKTLKDFRWYNEHYTTISQDEIKKQLRKEAEKWIKVYKEDIISHSDQIAFIEMFFNLLDNDNSNSTKFTGRYTK